MAYLLAFYRFLIRLYPQPYREEFGAEMEAVVAERLSDAATHGSGSLLYAAWHELRDWPGHCLRAYWQARRQRVALGPEQTISFWGSLFGALPHFLMALLSGGATLILAWTGTAGQSTYYTLAAVAGLLLLLMLVFAWWRGWPDWSVTWWGYLFYIVFVFILPSAVFDGLWAGASRVGQTVIDFGMTLPWLVALYLIVQRWPRAGVAAMLPALGMTWFLYLEFVPGLLSLLIQAATWAWLGIMAAVMLGRQRPGRDVWLLYATAVVVGVVYTLSGHFLTEPQVRDRTLAAMTGNFVADLLPALVPLVTIVLLHALRLRLREHGGGPRRSYSLFLAGILLVVAGAQGAVATLLPGTVWPEAQRSGTAFALVAAAGLLLIAVALGRLLRETWRGHLPGSRDLWLLAGLLAFLPIVYHLRLLQNVFDVLAYGRTGLDASPALQAWRSLFWQSSYGLGIVWLLLAAWVTGHVHSYLPPAAAAERTAARDQIRMLPAAGGPGGRQTRRYWRVVLVLAGLPLLCLLLMPSSWLIALVPNPELVSERFNSSTGLVLFARASVTLVVAAALLGPVFADRGPRRMRVLLAVAAGGLLVKALHSLTWLFIWDSTYDPLDVIWLVIVVFAVLAGGALLAIALPGRRKLRGAQATLLLLALVATVFALSQRVDFRHLTAARAERVAGALDRYYERHGEYPGRLQQLTPWTTLSVTEPVIVYGESWCYEGGDDYYRLGYIDRAHWSNPNFVGRIVYMAGDAPNSFSLCAGEAAALLDRYGDYYSYTDVADERQ